VNKKPHDPWLGALREEAGDRGEKNREFEKKKKTITDYYYK
jgi:hypothetical protein